tara:strand:- start:206 stop:2368 length:2163 start_codon:yes stop_codon:yes gene_type:complete
MKKLKGFSGVYMLGAVAGVYAVSTAIAYQAKELKEQKNQEYLQQKQRYINNLANSLKYVVSTESSYNSTIDAARLSHHYYSNAFSVNSAVSSNSQGTNGEKVGIISLDTDKSLNKTLTDLTTKDSILKTDTSGDSVLFYDEKKIRDKQITDSYLNMKKQIVLLYDSVIQYKTYTWADSPTLTVKDVWGRDFTYNKINDQTAEISFNLPWQTSTVKKVKIELPTLTDVAERAYLAKLEEVSQSIDSFMSDTGGNLAGLTTGDEQPVRADNLLVTTGAGWNGPYLTGYTNPLFDNVLKKGTDANIIIVTATEDEWTTDWSNQGFDMQIFDADGTDDICTMNYYKCYYWVCSTETTALKDQVDEYLDLTKGGTTGKFRTDGNAVCVKGSKVKIPSATVSAVSPIVNAFDYIISGINSFISDTNQAIPVHNGPDEKPVNVDNLLVNNVSGWDGPYLTGYTNQSFNNVLVGSSYTFSVVTAIDEPWTASWWGQAFDYNDINNSDNICLGGYKDCNYWVCTTNSTSLKSTLEDYLDKYPGNLHGDFKQDGNHICFKGPKVPIDTATMANILPSVTQFKHIADGIAKFIKDTGANIHYSPGEDNPPEVSELLSSSVSGWDGPYLTGYTNQYYHNVLVGNGFQFRVVPAKSTAWSSNWNVQAFDYVNPTQSSNVCLPGQSGCYYWICTSDSTTRKADLESYYDRTSSNTNGEFRIDGNDICFRGPLTK